MNGKAGWHFTDCVFCCHFAKSKWFTVNTHFFHPKLRRKLKACVSIEIQDEGGWIFLWLDRYCLKDKLISQTFFSPIFSAGPKWRLRHPNQPNSAAGPKWLPSDSSVYLDLRISIDLRVVPAPAFLHNSHGHSKLYISDRKGPIMALLLL